jgi:hypothetical protein
MAEEGTDELGLARCAFERSGDSPMKILDVLRDEVGHVAVLGTIPHQFHRIQVGSIGRQPLDLKPVRVLSLHQSHRLAVGVVAVQHQDELAPQALVHQGQERHNFLKADVVVVDLEIESQAAAYRGYRNPRDNRQTIMAVPAVLDGRLTSRCPTAADYGLEHEATFIDQDDTPPLVVGFFSIRGHSSSRQRWMASSSRSRARRSGFCGLHPIS